MKNRVICLLTALMLCLGAFCLPITAYAASDADATPPTISAWLNGDVLHVEARDTESGVEAVFVDRSRINYRVDNILEVSLRDYAGSGETVSVYATDFAGNKSEVIQLKNPYYTPPAASSASVTSIPAATSSQVVPEAPADAEIEETTNGSDTSPFTPDGTGTVVDDIVEQNGKEFFSITTAEGNVFYIIIDRYKGSENVYLLNAVTEEDLLALAEKSGGSVSAVPPTSSEEPTPQPEPEPEPEPEPVAKSGGNGGLIFIVLLVVLGAGGAGYYFKIYKPRQEPGMDEELGESEEDFEEQDGDSEYDGYYGDEEDYAEPDFTDTDEE